MAFQGALSPPVNESTANPHAISISYGVAFGGGFGFELGRVYDGRGGAAWFFRPDGRIGFGGGVSVNYEEITPSPGQAFEVAQWGGYDNYWGVGIGPATYGQGMDQKAWGTKGDKWFNSTAEPGQTFTYRGGSMDTPNLQRARKYGPVTRNPSGGLVLEFYKSWGKTFLWGIK